MKLTEFSPQSMGILYLFLLFVITTFFYNILYIIKQKKSIKKEILLCKDSDDLDAVLKSCNTRQKKDLFRKCMSSLKLEDIDVTLWEILTYESRIKESRSNLERSQKECNKWAVLYSKSVKEERDKFYKSWSDAFFYQVKIMTGCPQPKALIKFLKEENDRKKNEENERKKINDSSLQD